MFTISAMAEEEKFTPRPYQVELMEIALKQNTIIYLPTGAGKTYIAIMVLKRLSGSLLKSYKNGGKLSFILVNSIALAEQHAKYVRDHTIFSVGVYTGELNLDNWAQEEWEAQFDKHQVIIMTCQILVNLINNNFIGLERLNLIIFDECHRGVDDQPMRQVMKNFQNVSANEQPRILGLTATLLNHNCKLHKVMEEVKNLEVTYHSKVATVDGLDAVIGYSTNPRELFKYCLPSQSSNADAIVINGLKTVIETLEHIKFEDCKDNVSRLPGNLKLLEPVDVLKRLKNLIKDLIIHIEMLGSFGGYKACVAHLIQIERIKKHCQNTLIFVILNYVMTMIGWSKSILKETMKNCDPKERVWKYSSDKVLTLFEILREYTTLSTEDLCCLVFVQRRFTAKIIHHILQGLNEVDESFSHIKTNFVVGNNNNPYNDTRENLYILKKNREILDNFVNKEINVLVSSNVLEEGVDIPKCTLVIKFDKSEDYRSYIQSKGRARHMKSLYYTIIEKDVRDKFLDKYKNFQRIEESLNDLLVGKNLERLNPNEHDINQMYNEDELPPYYVNGPNSAQVNMASAISLLCRYCTSLSNDQYTCVPEWYVEEGGPGVRVCILLPTSCPIREIIQGPVMRSKRNAKRAAAYYACIMLHKAGEFDNNLIPFKKELNEEDVSFLFEHWPRDKEADAGVKKKKRLHNKEVIRCLQGKIRANRTLFLHVIKLNPSYSPSGDNSIIYNLYKTNLCFGLLSPNPLPDTCKFPLFDSNGAIEIEIKTNVRTSVLTPEEITELREFHYLIFNDLLEILKEFLIMDNGGNNAEMLLVVPVQDSVDVHIDFEVVRQNKTLKNKLEPTSSERMNLQVNDETYLHKIVSPWYRTQPTMYVVTAVCVEKSPLSLFPHQDFNSFVTYYEIKHGLNILNTSQPLLLVRGLSKSLNTFKPRGREKNRKSDRHHEQLEEHLVPELVIKQEFPSCLWIQARFLPCVLSRFTYLLKLRQLQEQIARDIGAEEGRLENCPPLELDVHLINYTPADRGDGHLVAESEASFYPMETNALPLENPGNLITRQYNKDFALKMLESEYSWKNIEEPKDIERELHVTVMDIEYYETFISEKPTKQNRLLKNSSPLKNTNLPAITYDKQFEEKHIHTLDVKFNNQTPNLCEFYQALTAAEANDICNLERLETLGDSFLKVIASLYIFFKFPNYNEGQSTTLKGKLVSNKNLYYLALKRNLGGVLKNTDFLPREEWLPPSFCVPSVVSSGLQKREYSVNSLFNLNISPEEQISGNLSKRTLNDMTHEEITEDEESSYATMCNFLNKQYVSDKSIADAVEALLGAFFLKGGFEGGIKFVEWIGILPASENVRQLIESAAVDPVFSSKATHENVDFHLPQWRQLENRLGYHFKNRGYLLQALTHASYTPNRMTQSYERLEFVGDAILDFLITCYIYEHCGYLKPGEVTDLRSALVNNNTFASLVVRCGFHKFLLMMNMKIQGHIDKFAEYLAAKDYVIDDEVLILVEEDDMNIAECVDVPKVLGDIFEALAGAVYLDSNKDLKTVWRVFYKIMWREIDLFSKNVPKNIIRRLYECPTAHPCFVRSKEIENQKIVVALEFMCDGRPQVVHGFGSNKSMAKRAAAKIALRSLKI